jgi:ElaB/YqjD/DUF883 family membrane-anchored ribosome-binding protein
MNQVTTGKLMEDLRVVVGDADELLKATAGQTGERMQQLRTRTEESLRGARARLDAARQDMDRSAREAAKQLNSQVHEHPWTAVGIAAGFGLLVGMLLGRH